MNLSIVARIILFTGCFVSLSVFALLYLEHAISDNTDTSHKQNQLIVQQLKSMQLQSDLLEQQAHFTEQLNVLDIFNRDFAQMRYWLSDLALSWLNESESKADELHQRLIDNMGGLRKINPNFTGRIETNLAVYFEKIIEAVDAYVDDNRVRGNLLTAEGRKIGSSIDQDLINISNKITLKLDTISQDIKQGGDKVADLADRVKTSATEVVEINEHLSLVAIFALVLCLVSGVIFCLVLKHNIHSPIKRLLDAITHIQQNNNLIYRVNSETDDELGKTSKALDTMIEHFLNIIREVSTSTDELKDVSNETSQVMEETREGVVSQQLATDQVATAITQMVASVEEVAKYATAAASSTSGANDVAKKGHMQVQAMIQQMNALSTDIENANHAIGQVSDDSSNIASVLDVIRGVSEQTNLLALNAAIEAARAGEAGRGFAVVADEVRTLAQRTQESTTEIQDMINRFQEGMNKAVSVIEKGVTAMTSTVEHAREAGEALNLITSSVGEIAALNQQIAAATEQQHAVAEDINRNIINIKDIANRTTVGIEKTALSAQQQKQCTEALAQLVGQFKIN
ncbi:MAG: methyl-accepting chemotaxis protein [Pseudomonadales bacterium]